MSNDQNRQVPEALRIADEFKLCIEYDSRPSIIDIEKAEAELRRLQAENEALRKHLNTEYPPLPMHYHVVYDDIDEEEVKCFTSNQMRAYVDADRATRT